MMMSDLPPDLIEEILSRVPATSLKRLRSTCKGWNTLFKDQRFSEKHFRKAPKESVHIMLKEHRLCSINVVPQGPQPCIEFKHGHGLEVDIEEVFHCDGLLVCKTMDNRLVVWNPCSGETRWIEPIPDNITKCSKFVLGYTNDKSCRNYKILRGWSYPNIKNIRSCVGSEIYEFSSNSWRVLDDDMDDTHFFIFYHGGLSLKGNIYWLAYDGVKDCDILVCFDFRIERSKRLCLPPGQKLSFKALSVVREEQLSVFVTNTDSSKTEIWMTTNNNVDNEADLSWRKSFAIDLFRGIFLTNLIIDEEKKVALSFIAYWGKSTRMTLGCYSVGDDMYVELVPDGIVKRFGESKTEWGFGQLIPLSTLYNTNEGYIMQDTCSFSAEIFIVNPVKHQEKVTFISNPSDMGGWQKCEQDSSPDNVFSWRIPNFSKLEDKTYYSDDFLVGDRYWRLGFNPKGSGGGRPHALPIFLYAQGFKPNAVQTNTWGAVNLRLKNQRSSNHIQRYSAAWYPIRSGYGVGVKHIILMKDLNDASKGYLVNDTIIFQAEMVKVSVTNIVPV